MSTTEETKVPELEPQSSDKLLYRVGKIQSSLEELDLNDNLWIVNVIQLFAARRMEHTKAQQEAAMVRQREAQIELQKKRQLEQQFGVNVGQGIGQASQ